MLNKLEDYLSDYVKNREPTFEKYVLTALDNEDHCLIYLESFQGTKILSPDLRNCEFLKDAEIFTADSKVSRHGHNTFKIFCLTEKGRKFAQGLKEEPFAVEKVTLNKTCQKQH
jgi:hypothetical protein